MCEYLISQQLRAGGNAIVCACFDIGFVNHTAADSKCTASDVQIVANIGCVNAANGQKVAKDITDKGGRAVFCEGDVTRLAANEAMAAAATKSFGRMDVFVANAGVTHWNKPMLDVTEDEFRYPGPKPQTKEAGVVMLADSIEATVRAAAVGGRLANAKDGKREGMETLTGIVDRIISERLEDGQLNECDLTLREIELIRRTFVQILEGIYHPRVEYPSLPVQTAPAAPATPAPSAAN